MHFKHVLTALSCVGALTLSIMPSAQAAVYDPDDPTRIVTSSQYPVLVEKLINRSNFALAQEVIEKGLEQNPLSAQLRFQRCVLFERMGKTDEAIAGFENFITRYPEIPEPYNNLAALYSAQGKLDRAEELLKRSLALRPNFALAHANLGNLYLARAKNAFTAARQNGMRSPALNLKLETINQLLNK